MNTDICVNEIDEITRAFSLEFGSLSEDQLNMKPNPVSWSIAQNIDHLIAINRSYFPVVENARRNDYAVPWLGKFDFVINLFGSILIKAMSPDRKKKVKTISIWEPSDSRISKDIFDKFEKHQYEVKQLITNSQNLLGKEVVISSPANKNIVYKLSSAFEIIIAHEKRHFNQAKEVLLQLP